MVKMFYKESITEANHSGVRANTHFTAVLSREESAIIGGKKKREQELPFLFFSNCL